MNKKEYDESDKTKNKNGLSKEEKSVDDDELLKKEFEKQIIQDRYHRKYLGRESDSRYKDEIIKKAVKKEMDKK
ncbi:MAG TPA: hypothetical protein HA221_02015 [Halobacteria archaeon]|jgi:hypothetical protein|nr:hypothetical protein [Halobacteria archaeon]